MWIYYHLFLPTNQKSRENAIPVRHLFWSVNVIGQQSLFRLKTSVTWCFACHTLLLQVPFRSIFQPLFFISFHFLFCFLLSYKLFLFIKIPVFNKIRPSLWFTPSDLFPWSNLKATIPLVARTSKQTSHLKIKVIEFLIRIARLSHFVCSLATFLTLARPRRA